MTNDNSLNTLTAIDGGRQKRSGRTIAKAVSLHLEGNREGAADVLCKAIDQGEQDPALFSALGHIYYEKAITRPPLASTGNSPKSSRRTARRTSTLPYAWEI